MNPITEKNKKGAGRPKGARNKSKLLKAQLLFDDVSEEAAVTLQAIMKNDLQALNLVKQEDIPMSLRLQACKIIIDKAIANEKEKGDNSDDSDNSDKEVEDLPRVVPVALRSTK